MQTWATATSFVGALATGSAMMHAIHWVTTTLTSSAEHTQVFSHVLVHTQWDQNVACPVPAYCSSLATLSRISSRFCLARTTLERTLAILVLDSVFWMMTTPERLALDSAFVMMVHFSTC